MIVQVDVPMDKILPQIADDVLVSEVTKRGLTEDLVVKLIEAKNLSIEMILGKLAVNKFMAMNQPKQ